MKINYFLKRVSDRDIKVIYSLMKLKTEAQDELR